jgi:GNAT superfamily N-acetyltransferase
MGTSSFLAARLHHVFRYARSRGLRRTWGAVSAICLFSHRRWYVFYKKLAVPLAIPADDEFQYRLATPEDATRLVVFDAYCPHGQVRDWLGDGDTYMFIALEGDEPVAFNCVGRCPVTPPFSRLTLASNQLFVKDAYALPQFRKRHISSRLIRYRNMVLRRLGFDEVIAAIFENNIASLRLTYDADVRLVQRVSDLRVGGFGWTWIEEDARPSLEASLREAGFPNLIDTH